MYIGIPHDSSLPEDQEVIVEYNKVIAQYMGYKYYPYSEEAKGQTFGWMKYPSASEFSKHNRHKNDYLCRTHKDMQFHYNWNWIMPVVQEIFDRHQFIIYFLGNSAYIMHLEDYKRPKGAGYGLPQYYNNEAHSRDVHSVNLAVWEICARFAEWTIANNDARIPIQDGPERQTEFKQPGQE